MTKIAKLLSVAVALSGLLLLAGCDGENNEPDPSKLASIDHDPQNDDGGQTGNGWTYKDTIVLTDNQGGQVKFDVGYEIVEWPPVPPSQSEIEGNISVVVELRLNDLWYLGVDQTLTTTGPDSGLFSFTRRW